MPKEIHVKVRAQYLRGEEWHTIEDYEDSYIAITGPFVDSLTRWVAWFEARGFEKGYKGLCESCLMLVSEQGHAPDCLYSESKSLLLEDE